MKPVYSVESDGSMRTFGSIVEAAAFYGVSHTTVMRSAQRSIRTYNVSKFRVKHFYSIREACEFQAIIHSLIKQPIARVIHPLA